MRCAISFVPPPSHPLTQKAAAWIGRDPYTGQNCATTVAGLTDADRSFLTVLPRRAGFQARLKPSFQLASERSLRDLEVRLAEFCQRVQPIELELSLGMLDSFFVFEAARRVEKLDRLAALVVAEFDAFRRPLTPGELDRRSAVRLTGPQQSNLEKWGGPFVFDQYHFHMTLAGPVVVEAERDHVRSVLGHYFGEAPIPVSLDRLVLTVQDVAHAPYRIYAVCPFGAAHERKIA